MMNRPRQDRYAVVLNVGLLGSPVEKVDITTRARIYAELLQIAMVGQGLYVWPQTNILVAQYASENSNVTEPTDVLKFDVGPQWGDTGAALKVVVNRVAEALSQDSIAGTYADITEGGTQKGAFLVGPKPETSGGLFDITAFEDGNSGVEFDAAAFKFLPVSGQSILRALARQADDSPATRLAMSRQANQDVHEGAGI